MPLKFYYDLLSQPCRAVMIFLKMTRLPFEHKEISITAGDQYSESFTKLNRFNKVPVFVDGDFVLTESIAILRYLCREMKVPGHWYPADNRRQARVDEYLEWQHMGTRLNCSEYLLRKFMIPMLRQTPAHPEKVAQSLKRMEKTLDDVETKWLPEGTLFLAGDDITIADLLGACEIEQPKIAGYDPTQGRPRIAAWLARVRQETAPYYDEVHRKLWNLAKKHKGVPPPTVSHL